jgi:hypothetical protein
MIPAMVYVLCALTSAMCAALLFRQYRRNRERLLLWSSLAFLGFTANNALVFADLVMLPDISLAVMRAMAAVVAVTVLVCGLIWETP